MAESPPLFRRKEVQRLLRALRDGKIEVLEPRFDGEHGFSYPAAAHVTGASAEALESILSELSSLGVLTPSVVDNIAVCPACGSFRLTIQARCPACGSPNLLRGVMIEHLACGHLDLEENYRKEGRLVCPRCGKTLKAIGVDYRRPGILYRCLSCRGVFPSPRKRYTCSNGHSFDEDDLVIREVKAYRLNPAKQGLIEREIVDFKPLLKEFEDVWDFEVSAVLRGSSGVEHEFSFALWPKGRMGVGQPDVVSELSTHEREVDSTAVLAFYAKVMDVKAGEKIFMAMPKLDEKGRLLASSYGMRIIEAKTALELQEKTANVLRQIAAGKRDALESEAEALEKISEERGE